MPTNLHQNSQISQHINFYILVFQHLKLYDTSFWSIDKELSWPHSVYFQKLQKETCPTVDLGNFDIQRTIFTLFSQTNSHGSLNAFAHTCAQGIHLAIKTGCLNFLKLKTMKHVHTRLNCLIQKLCFRRRIFFSALRSLLNI